VHDDGGTGPGEIDHLDAGAAASVLRFVACRGIRQEMAELAFAAAGLVEDRTLTARLQLRSPYLE
jgi:hypothetical protein